MTTSPPAAPEPERRFYVIYDARAGYDLDEARAKQKLLGQGCVIYAYRVVNGMALNGRRLPDEA